jgi:hypothetical protein
MRSNRSNRLSNDAGILFFNTWKYYIANFGCLHFKGSGIENNFYLLRPILLPNGERVYNRATFQLAKEAGIVREGIDYISNDHQAAVSAAKGFYHHQEEYEDSDFLFYIAYLERLFRLQYYQLPDPIAERARTLLENRYATTLLVIILLLIFIKLFF